MRTPDGLTKSMAKMGVSVVQDLKTPHPSWPEGVGPCSTSLSRYVTSPNHDISGYRQSEKGDS